MKRDVDLARQLLLDIESRGADCSTSVLRTGPNHEAEERVRYHLRLLIDAGYLKEVDRAANGVPCVRLTDAGHELIELSRHEERWRQAKWACQERTGGLSLAVTRAILFRWAVAGRPIARRRDFVAGPLDWTDERGYLPPAAYHPEPLEYLPGDPTEEVRYVRVRPPRPNGWRKAPLALDGSDQEWNGYVASGAVLPDYLL